MNIAIAFATLSGNSLEYAQEIQSYLENKNIQTKMFDLLETNADDLKQFNVVFLGGSTYGDGDLNPIAELFFSLTTPLTHDCEHTKFAIYALGDSSYPAFGNSGQLMQEKMQSMHAHVLSPIKIFDGRLSATTGAELREWVDEILSQSRDCEPDT